MAQRAYLWVGQGKDSLVQRKAWKPAGGQVGFLIICHLPPKWGSSWLYPHMMLSSNTLLPDWSMTGKTILLLGH